LFDFVERKPNRQDVTTAGLARMNMILHDFQTANIVPGNHCGQGQRNRARPVRMEKI
jgi:type I restriction-modification system DNA methylase subunit